MLYEHLVVDCKLVDKLVAVIGKNKVSPRPRCVDVLLRADFAHRTPFHSRDAVSTGVPN